MVKIIQIEFFDHADKTVRAEAFNLAVELYRWLGAAIKPQIDNLRPAQVRETNNILWYIGNVAKLFIV